ncbi:MAG TPA: acyltransferase family protein [Acidimicrobiales bacterium]|nr:acyltransferase family protein [Acidimicrobiales bacterium]
MLQLTGGRGDQRVPSLDGMRAFAVLGVILYHSVPWLPGGFYGVDAFFVLSGFLITSLLLHEWNGKGGVSLKGFWGRRARRLLPALVLLLATVVVVSSAFPSLWGVGGLRADVVATVLYVANWHMVFTHAGYFAATGAPPPLQHTWTLAVEEQFYVVWPLVVVAVMSGLRRRRGADPAGERRRLVALFWACVAGAAASAGWMAVLASHSADPNRAYLGTDTRAQAILVGAALAIAGSLWGPVATRAGRRVVSVTALLGAGAVAFMWARVPETSPFAFRGGFMVASLGCAAVLAAGAWAPRSPTSRVLSLPPLRAVGRISYGMYLWYWPMLLVLTGARTGLHGSPLLAARLGAIVTVATVSWFAVERPVQRARFGPWRPRVAVPGALAGGLAAACLTAALVSVPTTAVASPGVSVASLGRAVQVADTAAPASAATSAGAGRPVRIMVVGDSMAGSLAVGLAQAAPAYGAEVVNEGQPGCSVSEDQQIRVLWYTIPPGSPCVSGDPQAILGVMRAWVDRYDPDVVVYFARGELLDSEHGGSWQHVGTGGFDSWVAQRITAMTDVLSSRGGHVVLLTNPIYNSGERPDGEPWPENDPARVSADNAVLASVARSDPARVSLIDAGAMFTPGGSYRASAGPTVLRCDDGVHIAPGGGRWLAKRIMTQLTTLGRVHAAAAPARPPVDVPAVPSWYQKLPCSG